MGYFRDISYVLLDNFWSNPSYEGVEFENNIFTWAANEKISMGTLFFCNLQRLDRRYGFYMGTH
jgi:hypothetical protein